jgi:threonine-phosphate decarboxylase
MSRIFRVVGLRIGFVISRNTDLVSRLKRLMPPWSVNALTQAGVELILSRKEEALAFIRNSRDFLPNQRADQT